MFHIHTPSSGAMAILMLAALSSLSAAQSKDAAAAVGAQAEASAAGEGASPEYVLQAGDELEVRALDLPELSQKLRIRPDGRISLLLLNEIPAAGSTPAKLMEVIREGYAQHYRNPRVTVVVTSFMNQNVFVGGEVNQPRLIALNGRLSAAAAVFYAGGLKPTAKTKEIIILSNAGKGAPKLTKLDLNQVLTKGAPDIELQPFDVVFVPKSRIAKLDQFIDQYFKQLQPVALTMGFSYLLGGQGFQVAIP